MIDYHLVSHHNFEEFWNNIWTSDEFKKSLSHPFFQQLKNSLKKYPFFVFDYTHDRQYYHLTSHFRLIAKRKYSNPIIQDLYFLHEFSHCVEFHGEDYNCFDTWISHLDNNELYASLVSEAFVYFFIPSIRGKTFNPLWVSSFINPSTDCFHSSFPSWDMMHFNHIKDWPLIMQNIIQSRINLRNTQLSTSLTEAEKSIIIYNNPRNNWLPLWKPHYLKINTLLSLLKNNTISSSSYINSIVSNSDEYQRPFFPKK